MNCVDYLFESSSGLHKQLVLNGKEEVSYSLLWQSICELAQWLHDEIGENKMVVLASPNNLFFIQCYFAIMKSGNVCIPINPSIEKDGADYIVSKTGCEICCLTRQVASRLNLTIRTIDELSVAELNRSAYRDKAETGRFDADRLAQIIFTSGSTAEPKGVMISHGNIIANTNSIISYLNIQQSDIIAVVLPFYYCYGLSLLHTHVRVGGSLVLNNMFMLLGGVLNDLQKYKCTGFAGVPSHFQVLLRKSDSFKTMQFPHLKYVTQAGGKLHTVFIQEFIDCFPDVKFYVMYGQTEATARLSYLPTDRLGDKLGSIGKGVPGVELRVVDQAGVPVLPNRTGEIIAKGENVMLGYFQDPIGTEMAVKDGWLYTGDLATVDEDGFIYLTARAKEIIKVGGRRVSPKEIEEVVVSMHGVIDCTVAAVDDEVLGEAIKAIVTVDLKNNQLTVDGVRQYCSTKLANYKIPSFVEFVERLDFAPTGKKVKKQ